MMARLIARRRPVARDRRATGRFPVVSAAAWFASFRIIYGTFSPAAPYGGYAQSRPEYLLPGVSGLFFDQQSGFLATAPGFRGGADRSWPGVGRPPSARWRHDESGARRRLAGELLATFVLYLLAVASYRMWWGGASAPARFLVPVLMPLGIPAAWAWRAATRAADRAALLTLVTLSALLCAAFTWGGDGMVAFTTRALYGPLLEWMTRAVDLSSGLPSSFRSSYTVVAEVAAVWLTAGLAGWVALRAAARSRAAAAAISPWITACALMGGLGGAWTVTTTPPLRVDSSRLVALLQIEPRAHALLIGVRDSRFGLDLALVSAPRALPLLQLHQVARGPVPKGQIASAAPLRAGSYRIVLSPALSPDATVWVGVGRSGPVITKAVADVVPGPDGRRTFTIDLPVEVNAITVTTTAPDRRCRGMDRTAVVVGGSGEFAGGRAATAVRYGDLIAYFVTDRQFPEPNGIWIRPDGESVVIVQPDTPRAALSLMLRNGPFENTVDVRTGDGTERITLRPGEERALAVRLAAGARAGAVAFRVSRWFRPSEVDPKSRDVRRLGVWVEFRP